MNREEKSKNSKEKIIQSAFSLFSSKGYDSTSTQDIINLSGLSRGAMYHHFKRRYTEKCHKRTLLTNE